MTKNTKSNWVYVVMGEGDNNGTLPEYTLRVFASRDQAFAYAQELRDDFFGIVNIMERELIDRRVGERRAR